jgi:molecular chaperone GrpE
MEKDQNNNIEEENKEANTEASDMVSENGSPTENKGANTEASDMTSENGSPTENKKEILPEEKIIELEDKLTRTFAEMENQRRRFEKEKEDAFDYGGFTFAKEALNLIDNLDRSKQSLENDESLKNTEALSKMLDYFNIINKDLLSVFEKNDIKQIESINKKLDPNLHQAMMEIEDDQKEPGTIIQEIQKGFLMKDRLLRPSLVAVSKKSSKNPENNEKNQEKMENK